MRSAALRLRFAALEAATSVPPLDHVRVAPGGGVFLFFCSHKITAAAPQPYCATEHCRQYQEWGSGREKCGHAFVFPRCGTRGKRFDSSFRRKAGRGSKHFTAFPSTPPPSMPPDHHRPPSNGAPGCRGAAQAPCKKKTHIACSTAHNAAAQVLQKNSRLRLIFLQLRFAAGGIAVPAMGDCAPLRCAYGSPHYKRRPAFRRWSTSG